MNEEDYIELKVLLCMTVVIGIIVYVKVFTGIYG